MSLAPPTLAVAGATQILVAAAFFLVGNRLRKRNVAGASRGAVLAFVGWWWGLAIYLGMVGALAVAAVAGWMPFSVHLASRLFAGPLLCAAVAGLAYHILFILTGRSAWRWVLAVYYGAAAIAYDALTLASHPTSVVAADWQIDLAPPASTAGGTAWAIVLDSIGIPIILCSLAFLGLALRLTTRAHRTRAVLVGTSLLVWVGSGLLAQLSGTNAEKFVTLVLFGLMAAALVFIAYYPPGPMRRWIAAGPGARAS